MSEEQEVLLARREAPLPTAAGPWKRGQNAKLKNMKTESLNGANVTLIDWLDKQGRWRVQAEGQANTIDVLPERLAPLRRLSFSGQVVAAVGSAVANVGSRKFSLGGSSRAVVGSTSAQDAIEQARAEAEEQVQRQKAEVLLSLIHI